MMTEDASKGEEAQRGQDLHLGVKMECSLRGKTLTIELYIGLKGSPKYRSAMNSDDKKKQ